VEVVETPVIESAMLRYVPAKKAVVPTKRVIQDSNKPNVYDLNFEENAMKDADWDQDCAYSRNFIIVDL